MCMGGRQQHAEQRPARLPHSHPEPSHFHRLRGFLLSLLNKRLKPPDGTEGKDERRRGLGWDGGGGGKKNTYREGKSITASVPPHTADVRSDQLLPLVTPRPDPHPTSCGLCPSPGDRGIFMLVLKECASFSNQECNRSF